MTAFINNEEGCEGNLTGALAVKFHRAGGILSSHDDGGWHLNVPESGAAIGSLELRAPLVFQPGLSDVVDQLLHRFEKSGIIPVLRVQHGRQLIRCKRCKILLVCYFKERLPGLGAFGLHKVRCGIEQTEARNPFRGKPHNLEGDDSTEG